MLFGVGPVKSLHREHMDPSEILRARGREGATTKGGSRIWAGRERNHIIRRFACRTIERTGDTSEQVNKDKKVGRRQVGGSADQQQRQSEGSGSGPTAARLSHQKNATTRFVQSDLAVSPSTVWQDTTACPLYKNEGTERNSLRPHYRVSQRGSSGKPNRARIRPSNR